MVYRLIQKLPITGIPQIWSALTQTMFFVTFLSRVTSRTSRGDWRNDLVYFSIATPYLLQNCTPIIFL